MKKEGFPKGSYSTIGMIIAGFLILYGGFYLGSVFEGKAGFEYSYPEEAEKPEILDVDFSLFWETIETIKEKYVWIEKIEDQDLFYGAIRGLLESLDDPNSSFFSPEDAQRFEQDLSGKFGGIGAEIGIRDNQLVIIAPLKNTPAERAGLRAGDKIMRVDDESTAGITIEEAVRIIRGDPGDPVILTISREGWDESREIEIIRDVIIIPTLEWEMIDPGISKGKKVALIELYNFGGNSPAVFAEAAFTALLRGAEGVIVDLRNNSGGYLDSSINIAGWFLKKGDVVVKESFRSGEERVFRASGNASFRGIPTVVLVNQGSASASEILAGALRDQEGAVLVGTRTFGKGTVQEVVHLKDGSMVKISISEWLTPSGERIEKEGLEPDFEVELTEEDIEEEKDPQFEKALEILLNKLGA